MGSSRKRPGCSASPEATTSRATKPTWAGRKKACGAGRLYTKTLVGVAADEAGHAVGRIRLATLTDASDVSLLPFVEETVEPGSVVHTAG